ncbi:MAG: NUDIX hydrolase [Fimbriimonadaceae bacterium]
MRFPTESSESQTMEFYPAPFTPEHDPFAVVCFIWQGDLVLLAKIANRGWCVPSGRIEPNETASQAAVRESKEEAGAKINKPVEIGTYKITNGEKMSWATAVTSHLISLEEFQTTQESSDRMLCPIEKLPEIYYLWNPLTEAVFHHSKNTLRTES